MIRPLSRITTALPAPVFLSCSFGEHTDEDDQEEDHQLYLSIYIDEDDH